MYKHIYRYTKLLNLSVDTAYKIIRIVIVAILFIQPVDSPMGELPSIQIPARTLL